VFTKESTGGIVFFIHRGAAAECLCNLYTGIKPKRRNGVDTTFEQ
jgi:hypothetical protein